MKKKIIMLLLLLVVILSGCGANSNEPCTHCGSTPTKAYKNSVGENSYVCSECSTHCHFCNNKASKSYTNLAEQVIFVCKDCYDELSEMWN